MGWKLKGVAVIFGFVLIGGGQWIFAIPLFLYAFSGLLFRRKRSMRSQSTQTESGKASKGGWRSERKGLLISLFGVFLLILALAATRKGGQFSPFVLGSIGLALLSWELISRTSLFAEIRPVEDSILLRGSVTRFSWVALAEIKLLARDVGKALFAISERILVVASEKPSVYIAVGATAFGQKAAEWKIIERLKEINRTIAPLGAYLLPLDSQRVAAILSISVGPVELSAENLSSFLSSMPYDLISMETGIGLVKSIGAYRRVEVKKNGKASLIPSRNIPSRAPFTADVFKSIGSRVDWPNPDEYTAFLSSMFATQYVSQGERIIESSGSTSQTLLVKSLGGPQVELTRAQLEAIVTIYGGPTQS